MSGYLIKNARVSVTRNGVSLGTEYVNRAVQLDDDKAEKDVNIGGLPIVGKALYDSPSAAYKRGDRVVITAMAGHGTLVPDDNIFWVRRANLAGAPLPATEVGLAGGIPTNASVAVYRPSVSVTVPVIASLRAYYLVSGPERFSPGGGQLAGTLFVPDTTQDIELNDIIVFLSGDDLTTHDQQIQYQAGAVLHAPAPVPFLRVDISTTIGTYGGGITLG